MRTSIIFILFWLPGVSSEVFNKTLYRSIVDYFFPTYLQSPSIDMNNYLCYSHETNNSFIYPRNWISYGQCCECSKRCKYFGTCCLDAFFNDNITSLNEYIDLFYKKIAIKKHVRLSPVLNIDHFVPYEIISSPIITTCDDINSGYIESCDKNYSKSDLLVRDDSIVYRNKYCALCHGVTNYSYVSYQLRCWENDANKPIADRGCFLSIADYEYKIFPSFYPPAENMTCTKRERTLCLNSYLSLINTNPFKTYANPFCAICTRTSIKDNEWCSDYISCSRCDIRFPRFRMLISLSDNGDWESSLDYGKPVCPCGYTYDIFSDDCKKIKDPLLKSNCHDDDQTSFDFDFDPIPQLSSISPPPLTPYKEITKQLRPLALTIFRCSKNLNGSFIYKGNSLLNFHNIYHNITQYFENDAVFVKTDISEKYHDIFKNEKTESNTLYVTPLPFIPFTELYGFSPQNHLLDYSICADVAKLKNFSITKDCNIYSNNTTYSIANESSFWLEITKKHTTYNAVHCRGFHLLPKCSVAVFNLSLVDIEGGKVSTTVNGIPFSYSPQEYVPLIEGVGVCYQKKVSKQSIEFQWLRNINDIEKNIFISLLCLSIMSEILILTTYVLVKGLQNIPGKIFLALCISLLICDNIMLILSVWKNITAVFCQVAAATLHLFSLTLCTWSSVLSFDLWLTLRHTFNVTKRRQFFLQFNLFAWGVPAAVVIMCLLISYLSDQNSSSITYGKSGHCWITPVIARLTLYIIPFLLMTYGSFIMALIAIIKLKEDVKSNNSFIGKKRHLNFAKMAIKLCLVLGAPELIGLIQIPNTTDETETVINTIFGMFYNFLRASRGVLLFTAFAYNRNIGHQCCNVIHKRFTKLFGSKTHSRYYSSGKSNSLDVSATFNIKRKKSAKI